MLTDHILAISLGTAAAAVTSIIAALIIRARAARGTSSLVRLGATHLPIASAIVSVLVGGLVTYLSIGGADYLRLSTNTGDSRTPVAGLIGGCQDFVALAQNRWRPTGAITRAAPSPRSPQLGYFPGNQTLVFDGWVRTEAAYPSNARPWNSEVWFHLADRSGWVSYAGVRAAPTKLDESGQRDGGTPVATLRECEGVEAA